MVGAFARIVFAEIVVLVYGRACGMPRHGLLVTARLYYLFAYTLKSGKAAVLIN